MKSSPTRGRRAPTATDVIRITDFLVRLRDHSVAYIVASLTEVQQMVAFELPGERPCPAFR